MIFYFSGTGNSKHIAEQITNALQCQMINISDAIKSRQNTFSTNDSIIGFVFPVYAWNLPKIVKEFIANLKLKISTDVYVFAILTCGDDIGHCHNILAKELSKININLHSAYSIQMPNTYVCLPFFDTDRKETVSNKLNKSTRQIKEIITSILANERKTHVTMGHLAWIKSYIISPLFNKFLVHDRWFTSNNDCIKCGMCIQKCPLNNIILEGSPKWNGDCTGCLACYHSCPRHSIHYGKMTQKKGQYLYKKGNE